MAIDGGSPLGGNPADEARILAHIWGGMGAATHAGGHVLDYDGIYR